MNQIHHHQMLWSPVHRAKLLAHNPQSLLVALICMLQLTEVCGLKCHVENITYPEQLVSRQKSKVLAEVPAKSPIFSKLLL